MNEAKIAEVNKLVRKNSRNELVRLCKERNLCCTGTKHDMAVRLMGGFQEEEKKEVEKTPIKKIIIHRNQEGRWEWEGLIFDDKTKNVVGHRGGGGVVLSLRRQDIEKCRQYKFRYNLPEMLEERTDTTKEYLNQDSSDEEEEEECEDETEEP